jgi:hypothetical protein
MNEKTFEPGQRWRMRGGQIATIHYSPIDGRLVAGWDGRVSVFTSDGRYYYHDQESEFDLMEPA